MLFNKCLSAGVLWSIPTWLWQVGYFLSGRPESVPINYYSCCASDHADVYTLNCFCFLHSIKLIWRCCNGLKCKYYFYNTRISESDCDKCLYISVSALLSRFSELKQSIFMLFSNIAFLNLLFRYSSNLSIWLFAFV